MSVDTASTAADMPRPLTLDERREHRRLTKRWATMKATSAEISRCMELDRQDAAVKRRLNG